MLSIVVPCHNEEEMLRYFFKETEKIALPIKREYIFVNDGSSDSTLSVVKELRDEYPDKIKYISFSRNFGKEAAILAGLREASGDYVVLMDADLQDPPELLSKMYAILETSDYDCVGTRRKDREGEPPIRSWFSSLFYKVMNAVTDIEIVEGARDFRMMRRQMVDSILEVTEYNRFSKGIFAWVGYDSYYLEFENIEREYGETSWSFWGLFKYSIEGFVAFSAAPLRIASLVGILSFIISIAVALILGLRTIIYDNPTPGWTSLIVVILAMGGIQLLSIGILGEYLSKTFLETKKRPHYIVKEKSSQQDNESK